MIEGGGNIKGGNQDSGMSHQTDETADRDPGEPDRRLTIQQLLPPFPGQQVLRSLIVIRVNEEVKVRIAVGFPISILETARSPRRW
jgi:hypothetical protein